ncbi:ABC transporter substrate-binding protein [Clostridium sp. PL3]|uniref:ABC transporter substrate-binding protein n=1 Tax=Clostridium thailandense TaxID=2794346 RepID=A0A949TWG7_9CLOT|nr:ABC transporter substrate-binding protein [Clostridium thailandense]MBV7276612.1 ABC transporter substrate-binding protein [Clostridium thailandense]
MLKKGICLVMSVLLCVVILIGCGSKETTSEASKAIVVTDQAGREVTIKNPVKRIVSGYYISTSACLALQLKDKLVGTEDRGKRPFYKLFGSDFNALPNVGSAKAFNLEGCIALKPDLVILPTKLKDAAESMTKLGIPVILVNPENKEKLIECLNLIAKATSTEKTAQKLIAYYEDSSTKMENLTKGLKGNEKPVVYMGGTGSYLTTAPANMYQATLINLAGGVNAGNSLKGDSWTKVSYEQILAMNPDVIIIPSEANYTAKDVLSDPQLSKVTAVKNAAVYHMPSAFEAWDSPVPSCILGSKWLLSTLHKDLYSFDNMKKDASEFYKQFYGITIDEKLITK